MGRPSGPVGGGAVELGAPDDGGAEEALLAEGEGALDG